ncbi:MAG: cytidylate kinase-like family protein [Phycisphaerae bacterium]|nr:cytidylate kinase-like family protein [Phycisphaerae bacterium]
MAPESSNRSRDIAKLVERQMRNWELSRAQRHEPDEALQPEVADFITISRIYGSGGSLIAEALGERLNWPVFDREILQSMAGDDSVRKRLYEAMDERDTSWVESTLRWVLQGRHERKDYYRRLTGTVLAIVRQGPAVIVGRGVDLILPRERGLRVRIVAPLEHCAKVIAERLGTSAALAKAEVERVQQDRADYVRGHFNAKPGDPLRFDIMLNTQHMTIDASVELIVTAARLRGLRL